MLTSSLHHSTFECLKSSLRNILKTKKVLNIHRQIVLSIQSYKLTHLIKASSGTHCSGTSPTIHNSKEARPLMIAYQKNFSNTMSSSSLHLKAPSFKNYHNIFLSVLEISSHTAFTFL